METKKLNQLLNYWGAGLDLDSTWAKGRTDIYIYTLSLSDNDIYVLGEGEMYSDIDFSSDAFCDIHYAQEHFVERTIDSLREGLNVWISQEIAEEIEYDLFDELNSIYIDLVEEGEIEELELV